MLVLVTNAHCVTEPRLRNVERVQLRTAEAVVVKRALVIGNGAYEHVERLPNPVKDARALAVALQQLDFKTTTVLDANRTQLIAAIDTFVASLGTEDLAVISYSGHGVEVERTSVLLPVDVRPDSPATARSGGVELSSLLGALNARNGGVNLLIVDACRDNPFEGFETRGFSRPNDPEFSKNKSAFWFATSPSFVAEDGPVDGHSPFMQSLLAELAAGPERPLATLAAAVQRRVRDTTGQRQKPWLLDFTEESFAFAARPSSAAASAPAPSVSEGHALLIGISKYPGLSDGFQLKGATRDAERMGEWLEKGGAYRAVSRWNVKLLTDQAATSASMRAGLSELTERAHVGDRVVLFFAGHSSSVPDDGADEPDGKDEILVGADARCLVGQGQACDLGTALRDDEIGRWMTATQKKLGPRGHILVVTDAHPMFDDRTLQALRPPSYAPVVLIDTAGYGHEQSDEAGDWGGALTTAIGNELVGAAKEDSWRDLLERMESRQYVVGKPLARATGDLDQLILGNRWAPAPESAAHDPTRAYGPRSTFVGAGRLSGWFPGTQVSFVEHADGPPSGWPVVARGVVAQTGLRRARVEVTSGGDMDRVRLAVARPETRAMPPDTKILVELAPSVKTRRAELQALIDDLGLTSKDTAALRLVIEEQTNYFVVTDKSGRGLSGPISVREERPEQALARILWSRAFARYFQQAAALETSRVNAAIQTSSSCGTGEDLVILSASRAGARARGVNRRARHPAWIVGLGLDETGAVRTMGPPRLGGLSDCLGKEASAMKTSFFIASDERLDVSRHVDALATDAFGVTKTVPEEIPLGRADGKNTGLDDDSVELGAVFGRPAPPSGPPPSRPSTTRKGSTQLKAR